MMQDSQGPFKRSEEPLSITQFLCYRFLGGFFNVWIGKFQKQKKNLQTAAAERLNVSLCVFLKQCLISVALSD